MKINEIKMFHLGDKKKPDLYLRCVKSDDVELLRQWKNANRSSFFFSDIITKEMQQEWFVEYKERAHDFMLVVVVGEEVIGCMGFRLLEDKVDLYNIILGKKEYAGKGYMARALSFIIKECAVRYPLLPITVSVLKSNPALDWYYRRGFEVSREYDDYVELCYPKTKIKEMIK